MTTAENLNQNAGRINRCRLVLTVLAMPLFLALFLFLPAGTWTWSKGWLFGLVIGDVGRGDYRVRLAGEPRTRGCPDQPAPGTKPWDKVLLGFFILALLAIFPVAALDDGRFHWFPVPWWACALGYVLLLVGMVLVTWAQAVNKFFEPTVRIQTDRGQTVIDTGPYAIVRHPGYASCFPLSVGIALSLGSLWALIPAGLSCLVLILRRSGKTRPCRPSCRGTRSTPSGSATGCFQGCGKGTQE